LVYCNLNGYAPFQEFHTVLERTLLVIPIQQKLANKKSSEVRSDVLPLPIPPEFSIARLKVTLIDGSNLVSTCTVRLDELGFIRSTQVLEDLPQDTDRHRKNKCIWKNHTSHHEHYEMENHPSIDPSGEPCAKYVISTKIRNITPRPSVCKNAQYNYHRRRKQYDIILASHHDMIIVHIIIFRGFKNHPSVNQLIQN
jgi:hypothetical protein